MEIISHRGINFKDPENSLPAFEWAMKKGYSIELDIYLTKDGIPVISHDAKVDRMLNGTGLIKDKTLAEIKKLRFKSHENVEMPTFEEVCQLYQKLKPKNFFFCIQIKDMYEKNVVEKTAELVRRYKLPERCFFFEVDKNAWPLVEYIRSKVPDMKVGLHLPENSPDYTESHFRQADVIWADEITFDWMTKEMVQLAHKLGKRIYAISAELIPHSKNAKRYGERWKELIADGFDGICTDHAEELESFLRKSGKL